MMGTPFCILRRQSRQAPSDLALRTWLGEALSRTKAGAAEALQLLGALWAKDLPGR